MSPELLDTILASYRLPPPLRTEQIHNGTHRVYRARFGVDSGCEDIAIKVSRRNDGAALRAKHAEFDLLAHLGQRLALVPSLIAPRVDGAGSQWFPWGIVDRSKRIVSCYAWREGLRYRGQSPQLRNVASAYQQLRQALAALDDVALGDYATTCEKRFILSDGRLMLDERFGFASFTSGLERLSGDAAITTLLKQHLPFLEQETKALRSLVASREFSRLFSRLEPLHLELSPSNFSFHTDGTVSTIFDFDSLTRGVWLQELGWLVATFCIDYRKSFADVAGLLTTLLEALLEAQVLDASIVKRYLFPFVRFAYLDSIRRKLDNAYAGVDRRLGFLNEDIHSVLWLRKHEQDLNVLAQSVC